MGQSFSPPVRLGDCAQSLDLSFIPKNGIPSMYPIFSHSPNASKSHLIPFSTMPLDVVSIGRAIIAHFLCNNSILTELELTQQENPVLTDLPNLLQNSVNLSTLTLGFHISDSGSVLPTTPASIRPPCLQALKLYVTMNRPKGVLTARPAAHLMIDASQ